MRAEGKLSVVALAAVCMGSLVGCGLVERMQNNDADSSELVETSPAESAEPALETDPSPDSSDADPSSGEASAPLPHPAPAPKAPTPTPVTPRSEPVSSPRPAPAAETPAPVTRPTEEPAERAAEPVRPVMMDEPAPADIEPRQAEPAPEPEPQLPEIIEVEIAEGTLLELELLTALDSSVNRVGDEIQAKTISPVYVRGEEVLPEGTYLEGRVTEVTSSGRVRGRASLAFSFDQLSTPTGMVTIRTSYVAEQAESNTKDDAKKIGGAAGVGAIIGGIIGGKKGAAVGATVGGAGGTGVVLATKGDEVRLRVGTEFNVRLDEPVIVTLN